MRDLTVSELNEVGGGWVFPTIPLFAAAYAAPDVITGAFNMVGVGTLVVVGQEAIGLLAKAYGVEVAYSVGLTGGLFAAQYIIKPAATAGANFIKSI